MAAGPAQREPTHSRRPARARHVASGQDQFGRKVAICGVFAYVAKPTESWHTEFVPGTRASCMSCTTLIGADPSWPHDFPVIGLDERGVSCVYRPPELRRADYLARVAASGVAA